MSGPRSGELGLVWGAVLARKTPHVAGRSFKRFGFLLFLFSLLLVYIYVHIYTYIPWRARLAGAGTCGLLVLEIPWELSVAWTATLVSVGGFDTRTATEFGGHGLSSLYIFDTLSWLCHASLHCRQYICKYATNKAVSSHLLLRSACLCYTLISEVSRAVPSIELPAERDAQLCRYGRKVRSVDAPSCGSIYVIGKNDEAGTTLPLLDQFSYALLFLSRKACGRPDK